MAANEEVIVDTLEKIKAQIQDNPMILYMKGTPDFPQCGFSAHTINALKACEAKFAFVNVLENPDIREKLPEYAKWPTFPQLWVNGELIGGCDIVMDLFEKGELQAVVDSAGQPQQDSSE